MDQDYFYNLSSSFMLRPHINVGFDWPCGFREDLSNCGGRLYTTDDDGTIAYNIRSSYESKGLDTPKTVAFFYVGKR